MAAGLDESILTTVASPQSTDRFEQEWVQQVVRDALHLMESYCTENSRLDMWEIFRLRIVNPMLYDAEPTDYEQIVQQFRIQTPRQAINLLASAKRCFNKHLREAVGRYVSDENRIDEEIADLHKIVGR